MFLAYIGDNQAFFRNLFSRAEKGRKTWALAPAELHPVGILRQPEALWLVTPQSGLDKSAPCRQKPVTRAVGAMV
jgi:hypothetical protein